ncbi:hypothetical protein V1290_002504 [Bradyrhizobium sp. AZCC 1578]|uniref:hypothetical protein n=1 Tax=Bradyrhizobium sp. AZCC 1578 TaxID=3117027 RepID=UPI002FF234E3
MEQLPPGRYPNGTRVYADGEWESIVRTKPLGKREIASLRAYFEADGAADFNSGGIETNERLEIRGLIEKSSPPRKGYMPFYRITVAGRAEWLKHCKQTAMKSANDCPGQRPVKAKTKG